MINMNIISSRVATHHLVPFLIIVSSSDFVLFSQCKFRATQFLSPHNIILNLYLMS